MIYLLLRTQDLNYFFFFHASRTEAGAHINLRAVALICSLTYLGFEIFTDGQFDTVFGPSKHLAVA